VGAFLSIIKKIQPGEKMDLESLLVDDDLADQVRELWNAAVITNGFASWGWCMLALNRVPTTILN